MWQRLGAVAGIAGPLAFTAAWVIASLRQTGHPVTEVQISGLAAPDARDPGIMIAGFVVLGGCSVAFGGALSRSAGGPGPRLIQCAGVLTVAAGLLRRDRMLLGQGGGESWHNQAHDVVSLVIYVLLVAAPALLAVRFRRDPRWRPLAGPLLAGSVATGGLLVVFASDTVASGTVVSANGIVQRVAVTLPLAMVAVVAGRLLAGQRQGPAISCNGGA
jgi:hypothetical membrane protein